MTTRPGIPTSPLVDPQTGMPTAEWIIFFQALRDNLPATFAATKVAPKPAVFKPPS